MNRNVEIDADERSLSRAALLMLIILQSLMLAALYTRTQPHPPLEVALLALSPFISASIAIAVAAFWLPKGRVSGGVSLAACLTALVSYGPHKYFDTAFASIWPAVLLAQASIIVVIINAITTLRKQGSSS